MEKLIDDTLQKLDEDERIERSIQEIEEENDAIKTKRKGHRSAKNGHLGVYTLCSGPDPNGPVPGERVIIAIYNHENKIVRQIEQIKGDCIDPGWIDFFNSYQCRPSVYSYHIVDTDEYGNKTILATHTDPKMANRWFIMNMPEWIRKYGVLEKSKV